MDLWSLSEHLLSAEQDFIPFLFAGQLRRNPGVV